MPSWRGMGLGCEYFSGSPELCDSGHWGIFNERQKTTQSRRLNSKIQGLLRAQSCHSETKKPASEKKRLALLIRLNLEY